MHGDKRHKAVNNLPKERESNPQPLDH